MKRYFIPVLIFGSSFLYYVYQVCPTFYFWDSAELTAAVLGGGVPHPPGFPSLLIIARIWSWILPFNNDYDLNLLAALFASIGLAVWYSVLRDLLSKLLPKKSNSGIAILSLISVMALGLSFSYSIQAVRFEVYSLNFLCFALLLFLALKVSFDNGINQVFYMLGFIAVTAISLGAHHFTILLSLPGIALILYYNDKLKLKYIIYFLCGTATLLIPLYLSIYYFSSRNPALNWGDPSNFGSYFNYFFLKEFSTPISSLGQGHLIDNLMFAVRLITRQIGVLGSILALWGIVKYVRLAPRLTLPFLVILLANIFSILFFENYFYENYDLHGYLLFSVAISGLFMVLIIDYLSDRISNLLHGKTQIIYKAGRVSIPFVLALIAMYFPLKGNIYSADLSRVTAAEEYAFLFCDKIPDNSIIITSYYNTYFCLLARQSLNRWSGDFYITNVYNWDHGWGRNQTATHLEFSPGEASSKPDFYRTLLNKIKGKRLIFVEYDNSSAPLANYLKPQGLAYKFSLTDTSLIDPYSQIMEIDHYSKLAVKYKNIESIRTWVLWFQNRGEYYMRRGEKAMADRYFEAAEHIVSDQR